MIYVRVCDGEMYEHGYSLDGDFVYLSGCFQPQTHFIMDGDQIDYLCYLPLLF